MDVDSVNENSTNPCPNCTGDHFELKTNFEEQSKKLQERIDALKNVMGELRNGLINEKELLKQDTIESEMSIIYPDSECTTCTNDVDEDNMSIMTEPTLDEISILDYEQKISQCQEVLMRAQFEKRMHLRRNLIASVYKQRLIEIENLCNKELLRVQQNVQSLQPLRSIVAEWNFNSNSNTNDELLNSDAEITGAKLETQMISKTEAFKSLQHFENKVSTELKVLQERLSPTQSNVGPLPAVLQEQEKDALILKRLQTMGWCHNEINHNHKQFNPLM